MCYLGNGLLIHHLWTTLHKNLFSRIITAKVSLVFYIKEILENTRQLFIIRMTAND